MEWPRALLAVVDQAHLEHIGGTDLDTVVLAFVARARLEAVVAERGWVLLAPVRSYFGTPRGADVLIVGHEQGGCARELDGEYAMDPERRVHLLRPDYVASQLVTAKVCGCGLHRCGGVALPPTTLFVSAPPGATLAEPLTVTVSVDSNANFIVEGLCPPMP